MASDNDIVDAKDQKVLDRNELRIFVLKRKSAELEAKADASAKRLRVVSKQREEIAKRETELDQQLEDLKKQRQAVAEELADVSKQRALAYDEWELQEKLLNEKRPVLERIIELFSPPTADLGAK